MTDESIVMSAEGVREIEKELTERIEVMRKEIAENMHRAAAEGDRSENAAYHEAKEQQALNEARIRQLEDQLQRAVIGKTASGGKIGLGSKITLKNLTNNSKQEYVLVGQSEANPTESKISIGSPIGAALNGKSKGDKVEVALPMGNVLFEILDVA